MAAVRVCELYASLSLSQRQCECFVVRWFNHLSPTNSTNSGTQHLEKHKWSTLIALDCPQCMILTLCQCLHSVVLIPFSTMLWIETTTEIFSFSFLVKISSRWSWHNAISLGFRSAKHQRAKCLIVSKWTHLRNRLVRCKWFQHTAQVQPA